MPDSLMFDKEEFLFECIATKTLVSVILPLLSKLNSHFVSNILGSSKCKEI